MLANQPPGRKATVLLLILIAGFVDAIGLAETGRYFVSFMSGTLTTIGKAAGEGTLGAVMPLGLVALFVAGATAGALLGERTGPAAGAALLLSEAALLVLSWAGFGSGRPMLGVVPLPVAMGLANIVSRPLGATYATGTLVALGEALAGVGRGASARTILYHVVVCGALVGGAVAGTVGRLRYGGAALLAPAGALLLLGLVELAIARTKKASAAGR